ncbi:hypothetical protein BCR42DRAFT_430558, partial [Absidia repens]
GWVMVLVSPSKIVTGVRTIGAAEFHIARTMHAIGTITGLVTAIVPSIAIPSASTAIVMESTVTERPHGNIGRERVGLLATGNDHITTRLLAIIGIDFERHPCIFATVAIGQDQMNSSKEENQ